ncbi:MAG: DUF47 family protein [Magnetococcales bacterium]|nr:DUF47 family protein [Magnetococcales bacterium]
MSGASNSLLTKVLANVFPKVPDFYGMINEQCKLAVEVINTLADFMDTGEVVKGEKVRELEHVGDEIKARNMDVLNSAFATPMDREDIYRAVEAIDAVINYCKTTVREMEILGIAPDQGTREMVGLIREGVEALARGYGKLSINPKLAEEDCMAVRKAERNVEKAYRRNLAALFDAASETEMLNNKAPNAEALAMGKVVEMFKRREIYRHLSNTADQMAHAAHVLHDIVVQIS